MNLPERVQLPQREDLVAALLGRLATELDPTPTQVARAKTAYETVGGVLAASTVPELKACKIIPHGSWAIGTVNRPIDEQGEFDVDLICRLAGGALLPPQEAKRIVGDRLKEDGRYRDKLSEKRRCWRIDYKGEFHLDVAPVKAGPNGPDLIPDRQLLCWLETHPEAFAIWFNGLADRAITRRLVEAAAMSAEIVPFPTDPDDASDRGWLRRLIQILKRHRDLHMADLPEAARVYCPISVIITTLAAYSFARVVANHHFGGPFELVRAIVSGMPDFIKKIHYVDRTEYVVASPVADENFANRWSESPKWYETFVAWHADVLETFDALVLAEGLDTRVKILSESFGSNPSQRVIKAYTDHMNAARRQGTASIAAGTSYLSTSATAAGTFIRPNTFYGGT